MGRWWNTGSYSWIGYSKGELGTAKQIEHMNSVRVWIMCIEQSSMEKPGPQSWRSRVQSRLQCEDGKMSWSGRGLESNLHLSLFFPLHPFSLHLFKCGMIEGISVNQNRFPDADQDRLFKKSDTWNMCQMFSHYTAPSFSWCSVGKWDLTMID